MHHVKTNCDELIGSVVKVTETVDNFAQTGTAIAQGKEWTARCKSDKDRIEKDSLAKVTAISGVKLILENVRRMSYDIWTIIWMIIIMIVVWLLVSNIRIVPQAQAQVVERLGGYQGT